jgi:DNA-binding transcriptional LysR family regulator
MERRHLEYFLAVVDHQGFTHAAHAHHIAQPSLSQAIRALERELGADLFVRRGRGIRLTAAGEALVGAARQTLRDFEAARAAVMSVAKLERGRLDIAAAAPMSIGPLVRLVSRFHDSHPGVSIRILDSPSTEVLDLVRSGESELAITWAHARPEDLMVLELEPREVYLVLPPGTVCEDEVISLARLKAFDLIVGSATKQGLIDRLDSFGVSPGRFVVETSHRESMLPFVLAGVGAALLPSEVAAQAAGLGAVVRRLEPPLRREAILVHRNGRLSAAARAFVDIAAG